MTIPVGEDKEIEVGKKTIALGCVIIFLFVLLVPILGSIKTIQPNEVAVATRFGSSNGFRDEGTYLALFENYTVYDKKVRTFQQKYEAGSIDSQFVYVDGAFTYGLKPEAISKLYSDVGTQEELQAKIISPTLLDVVKQATAQFTAEEVLPKQSELRTAIKKLIDERMNTEYLYVVDFAITNIDFTPQYNAAIEAKKVAQQQAEQNKIEIEKQRQQAEFNLEKANLDAKTKIASAQGDAEAQRLQQQTLTPALLEKLKIDSFTAKWNGVLPLYMGGDINSFLNVNK